MMRMYVFDNGRLSNGNVLFEESAFGLKEDGGTL